MNSYLLISAILTIIVALIHSVLGEKLIITPVLRLDLPKISGSDFLTKRTLRFAWHITSLAWLGIAGIFIYGAIHPMTVELSFVIRIMSAMFLVSSIITLITARGRHFAWWVFLLIAILSWMGS